MSRRFRLATVERLRAARLEEAGTQLQAAADALGSAIHHRDSLTRALLAPVDLSGATPEDLRGAATHRERLREQRAAAAEQVDQAEDAVGRARAAWLDARAELKAVESLHDKHRRALAAADARREQSALDELAGIQASRRLLAAARDGRDGLAQGGAA